VIFID